MSDHTPGPWAGGLHINAGALSLAIVPTRGVVMPQPQQSARCEVEEAMANAARIIACVNACEGLTAEQLAQPFALSAVFGMERDHFRALNKQLVDALGNFRTWHAEHFEDFTDEVNAQLLCLDNEAAAALEITS